MYFINSPISLKTLCDYVNNIVNIFYIYFLKIRQLHSYAALHWYLVVFNGAIRKSKISYKRKFSSTGSKGKIVAVGSTTTLLVYWVWDERIFQILCKAMDILYTMLKKGKGFQLPLTAVVCRSLNR